MRYITQLLTIAAAIGTIFAILNTGLASYMVIVLAGFLGLGVAYLLLKKRLLKATEVFTGSKPEVYAFIVIILLAIFLTDGFNSLLFFLIYFLPFGIAILFEPIMAFVLFIGLLTLFIQHYINQDLVPFWLQFSMLFAVTPISFFFGKEFHRREKMDEQLRKSAEVINSEAQKLKNEVKQPPASEQIETIIEETSHLKDVGK